MLSIGPVTSQRPVPGRHSRRSTASAAALRPPCAGAVEARQLRHGEGSFAGTVGRQAVNRQVEAGQLMERTGEDRCPLPTGGGIWNIRT